MKSNTLVIQNQNQTKFYISEYCFYYGELCGQGFKIKIVTKGLCFLQNNYLSFWEWVISHLYVKGTHGGGGSDVVVTLFLKQCMLYHFVRTCNKNERSCAMEQRGG